MKLECSSCQTRYSVDDAKIPSSGAKIRCRKCSTVILVPPRHEAAPTSMPVIPPSPEPALQPLVSRSEPVTPPGHVTVTPQSPRAASAAAAPPSSGFSFLGEQAASSAPVQVPLPAPGAMPPLPPTPPEPAAAAPSVQAAAGDTGIPAGLNAEGKAQHERARRLARVLASDIAIYNQEKKDRGLAEGNLVAVLGYEIKKSWEIYKERVGADFANSTPYFRNALNDLLAEGRKIF